MPKGWPAGSAGLAEIAAASIAAKQGRVTDRIASGKKRCSRCGQAKVLAEDFSPAPSQPDGRDAWCKRCRAALAAARLAKRRQAILDAVAADPELRTATLALEWRLNIPHEQAVRVALVVDRRPARVVTQMTLPERDRVEVVADLRWDELVALAWKVRVRPGPGRRRPAHPRPHLPRERPA